MSGAIKKLARELGLTRNKGLYYGVVQGYPLALTEGNGLIYLQFAVEFQTAEGKGQLVEAIHAERKTLKLNEVKQSKTGFVAAFAAMTAGKRVPSFLEWLWPEMARCTARGDLCPLCGLELSGGQWVQVEEDICMAHASCISREIESDRQEHTEERAKPRRRLLGLLGATLGALVGAIQWVIVYYLGWMLAVLGAVIGLAAKKGYELLGGRPSWFKIVAVIVPTILAVLISFPICDMVYIMTEYDATAAEAAEFLGYMVTQPDYWLEYTGDILIGLLFALLTCGGIIGQTRRAAQGPQGRVRPLEQAPAFN